MSIETQFTPGLNRDKIKSPFHSDKVAIKRETITGRQNENVDKVLYDWLKRMCLNNLPVNVTILKTISHAKELNLIV